MVGEEQAQSRMSKESLVDAEQQATLKVLGYLFLRMGRLDSARRTFTALAALLPEDAPAQERSWVERNLAAVALEEETPIRLLHILILPCNQ